MSDVSFGELAQDQRRTFVQLFDKVDSAKGGAVLLGPVRSMGGLVLPATVFAIELYGVRTLTAIVGSSIGLVKGVRGQDFMGHLGEPLSLWRAFSNLGTLATLEDTRAALKAHMEIGFNSVPLQHDGVRSEVFSYMADVATQLLEANRQPH